jgi:hypothetical protein
MSVTSQWLTPDEAAAYCKVSRNTFNRWRREEGIRPDGVAGKRPRFLPQTLDGVMAALAKRPKSKLRRLA